MRRPSTSAVVVISIAVPPGSARHVDLVAPPARLRVGEQRVEGALAAVEHRLAFGFEILPAVVLELGPRLPGGAPLRLRELVDRARDHADLAEGERLARPAARGDLEAVVE